MAAQSIGMIERLVAFDTTSALSNLKLIEDVQGYLAGFGVESRLTFNAEKTKANLYATLGPADRGGVVLSGHTDVVPVAGQNWTGDPFKVRRGNGRLYGRGTSDMKSFIAVALTLVPEFIKRKPKTPIHFAFSFDEEVGCHGARHLVEDIVANLPLPRIVIVGEPTMMKLVNAHKGAASYEVTITGVEGHSSAPQRGANAIFAAVGIISEVLKIQEEFKAKADPKSGFVPPYATFNVGIIEGGTAGNIIPNKCRFKLELRVLPGESEAPVIERIKRFAADAIEPELKRAAPHAGIRWEEMALVPPLTPLADSAAEALIRLLTGLNESDTAAYGTEAGLFQRGGMPAVIFGPGDIAQAHQPDEFIDVAQIEACEAFMLKLADWAAR
ncbi:MAG: acetylornithine deacetylase [Proteobacteria bacterium]|nr:acetylornithine deacetylase [Pseudomonadota bacterium]MBI3498388.1 acetylornithine deacetylase [Pseudomonadota bacterium]